MKKNLACIMVWLTAGFFTAFFLSSCSNRPHPSPVPTTAPLPSVPTQRSYQVFGEWYHPLPNADKYKERGVASWYGRDFHGRKTSNGETYNMFAMTAAHKTLPLGTFVRVQNLGNGKSTVVRINDRGPFVRGRVIDLSFTAAKELDIVGPGTAPVEVVAVQVSMPPGSPVLDLAEIYLTGNFYIQIGSFSTRQNAQAVKSRMETAYRDVRIVEFNNGQRSFYRVWVGKYKTMDQAKTYEAALIQKGFNDAFIIAE